MGVGGQRHAPATLTPGMTLYSLYRRLGGPLWLGDCFKNLSIGFQLRLYQSGKTAASVKFVRVFIWTKEQQGQASHWHGRRYPLHSIFGLLIEGLRLWCSTANRFNFNKHIYFIAPETPRNIYHARIVTKIKLMHAIKYWRWGLRQ